MCRDTGELIASECGDQDKATLKKLIGRLEKWQVRVYSTDTYETYASVLPKHQLVQTKAETHGIARNNCRMRHGFGRFKRKSIIVSKYRLEKRGNGEHNDRFICEISRQWRCL